MIGCVRPCVSGVPQPPTEPSQEAAGALCPGQAQPQVLRVLGEAGSDSTVEHNHDDSSHTRREGITAVATVMVLLDRSHASHVLYLCLKCRTF